jgi:hypothetical protein
MKKAAGWNAEIQMNSQESKMVFDLFRSERIE